MASESTTMSPWPSALRERSKHKNRLKVRYPATHKRIKNGQFLNLDKLFRRLINFSCHTFSKRLLPESSNCSSRSKVFRVKFFSYRFIDKSNHVASIILLRFLSQLRHHAGYGILSSSLTAYKCCSQKESISDTCGLKGKLENVL